MDDRVSAVVVKDEQAAVSEDGGELDQLQLGQVALPPEVLLEAGAERREEVVRVHHNVNEEVEHGAEALVAAGNESEKIKLRGESSADV